MKFPSYNTLDIILLFISQQYTAKRLIEKLISTYFKRVSWKWSFKHSVLILSLHKLHNYYFVYIVDDSIWIKTEGLMF